MSIALLAACLLSKAEPQWVQYEGTKGPGKGKHIVLLAGDEEYRSEEGLPQLGKILAKRHGFKCSVLFSQNEKGEIDPKNQRIQPGLHLLDNADLCVMLLRFRNWPDQDMAHFDRYVQSGKPIVALRTSTHAFDYPPDSTSPFRGYDWQSQDWPGGFGKQVLGETWVSHWGNHGSQATRGVLSQPNGSHPILKGMKSIFGDSDVYEASPPPDATILVYGEVVAGMNPKDAAATGEKRRQDGVLQGINEPKMPISWIRSFTNETGKKNRIFATTMGAATDLLNEDLRRLLVNACYWGVELEQKIPERTNVDLVGTYQPTPFGFEKFVKGMRPKDHAQLN